MWSSKSLGSRFQHGIFRLIVRLRLVFLARLLLYPVSFHYALVPRVRRRYAAYLRHRFGSAGGFTGLVRTARAYKNFADVLLDRLVLRETGRLAMRPHAETLATMRGILGEGKGCLLVSAHFGSWQIGTLGLEGLGHPIRLVQWVDEGDVDRHYFDNGRTSHPVSVLNAREGLTCALRIREALAAGDIVCFMGDRLTPNDRDVIAVPFLGEDIFVPAAPYALASATGAPIVHAFSLRIGHVVTGLAPVVTRLAPHVRRDRAALRAAALRFVACLEELVDKYPYHFFNFHDLWSCPHEQERTHRRSEDAHPGRTAPGRSDP